MKSDLMKEMEKIEPEIFQIGCPKEEDEDELIRKRLTRAEMIERSRELRYLRIKESQKSAKARLRNKIKSKTYHRILKKEKLKQQLKEFELLQKTDPEAALKKIEQLDRNRVQERADLRHRNTGTWAKNLQVRAKYDKDVRKQLAEQIQVSRELTSKKPIEDEDSDDNNGNEEIYTEDYDPFNPWLKSSESRGDDGLDKQLLGSYRQYWIERNTNDKNIQEFRKGNPKVEKDKEPDEQLLTNAVKRSKNMVKSHSIKPIKRKVNFQSEWLEEDIGDAIQTGTEKVQKKKKCKATDDLDDLFDAAEDDLDLKLSNKLNRMKSTLARNTKQKQKKQKKADEIIELGFKNQKKVPKIDEDLIEDDNVNEKFRLNNLVKTVTSNGKIEEKSKSIDDQNINIDEVATMKTRNLQTALPDTIYTDDADGFVDYDDADYYLEEQKKLTIAEAFGDDDIVAEFQREKEDEENKNAPQEIDLSMPGWGSWGGAGIDPAEQKRRRLVIKAPAPEKRRPECKGNVVIIENRDTELQKHLVTDLPFPFTTVTEYEQSIRAPLGKDFIPETAHRLLTKPAVTTKSGTIIEPMSEKMLVKAPKKARTKTARKIEKLEAEKEI